MNASLSEDSVAETALAKKNSDGKKLISFCPLSYLINSNVLEEIFSKQKMLAVQLSFFSLLLIQTS